MLKQSLQQLIQINRELTQYIEEFNNEQLAKENNQQTQQTQNTMKMLNEEIQNLRNQLHQTQSHFTEDNMQQYEMMQQRDVESLVSVLEELIQSFQNVQVGYEGQMQKIQKNLEEYRQNFETVVKRMQQQYKQKLSTVQAILIQMQRKD